jgi:hypothetical protein
VRSFLGKFMESCIFHWLSTRVMYFEECLLCIIGKCEFILGEFHTKFHISNFFSTRNIIFKIYEFHFWGISPPKFLDWTIFVGLKLPLCDEQVVEMKQWHGLTMNKLFETMVMWWFLKNDAMRSFPFDVRKLNALDIWIYKASCNSLVHFKDICERN